MATPQAGMITAVSFVGLGNAQRILNTIHYRMSVAWSNATIAAYYDAFYNEIKATGTHDLVTSFLAMLSGQYTLVELRLQVIYPIRYRAKAYAQGTTGIRTGALDVQNVAGSLGKRVEQAGRSKVGRIQIGGLSRDDYVAGLLTAAQITRMNTWAAALIQQIFEPAGVGLNVPVLYHPGVNANPKFDLIEGFVPGLTVRTQRTRTIGKGE